MKSIVFALPPFAEQNAILEEIADDTRRLHCANDHARRESELLREYRARLIADVVTGKLDVREAAVRLPEADAGEMPLEVETTEEEEDDDLAPGPEEVVA
jgi:hypothetical protein